MARNPAYTIAEVHGLINTNLASATNITATEHRDVGHAIEDSFAHLSELIAVDKNAQWAIESLDGAPDPTGLTTSAPALNDILYVVDDDEYWKCIDDSPETWQLIGAAIPKNFKIDVPDENIIPGRILITKTPTNAITKEDCVAQDSAILATNIVTKLGTDTAEYISKITTTGNIARSSYTSAMLDALTPSGMPDGKATEVTATSEINIIVPSGTFNPLRQLIIIKTGAATINRVVQSGTTIKEGQSFIFYFESGVTLKDNYTYNSSYLSFDFISNTDKVAIAGESIIFFVKDFGGELRLRELISDNIVIPTIAISKNVLASNGSGNAIQASLTNGYYWTGNGSNVPAETLVPEQIWQSSVGNITSLVTPEKIALTDRFLLGKNPIDLASANNLTLTVGNVYKLADITNQIQLITSTGWTDTNTAPVIYLIVPTGGRVKHLQTVSTIYHPISLASGIDFQATQETILAFVYENSIWKEVGATTLALAGKTDFIEFTTSITAFATQTVGYKIVFSSGTNTIDWGDGSSLETLTSNVEKTHTFAANATYKIRIISTSLSVITSLTADNNQIQSYKNLSSLTGCTTIDLSYNILNIKILGSEFPASLTTLNVIANKLVTEINFEGHQGITTLIMQNVNDLSPTKMDAIKIINFKNCINLVLNSINVGSVSQFLAYGTSNLVFSDVTNTKFLTFFTNGTKLTDIVGVESTIATTIEDSGSLFNNEYLIKLLNSPLVLTKIVLSNNKLSGTPILPQKNSLTYLDIASNTLLSGYISSLMTISTALTTLSISGCTNLNGNWDFRTLIALTTCYVANTKIVSFDFSGMTTLTTLNSWYPATAQNSIVNLSGCTNLLSVRPSNNYFSFHGGGLTSINLTNCTRATMTEVDIFSTTNVTITGIATMTQVSIYYLVSNGWDQTKVDAIVADVVTAGKSNGSLIIITGNTGNPTLSPGYATLTGRGWTIS